MQKGIVYKYTIAMPGSELHQLLKDAASASGSKKEELLKKAEKSYKETEQRHKDLLKRYS